MTYIKFSAFQKPLEAKGTDEIVGLTNIAGGAKKNARWTIDQLKDYVLQYAPGGGGITKISEAEDTNIVNATSGQVLMYNGVKWQNQSISVSVDAYTKAQSDARYKPIAWLPLWADIADRPTYLSQFINNLGNYGNFAYSDGSNASGTWAINISGTAQNAITYGGQTANFSTSVSSIVNIIAQQPGGSLAVANKSLTQSWLELGSFAYRNAISGSEVITPISYAGQDIGVAQMLRWKNYGNNHVIFDASNGTAPNGTFISNKDSQNAWSTSYPTLMGWNGVNTYGLRVDSARNADYLQGHTGAYDLQWITSNGATTTIPVNINADLRVWGNNLRFSSETSYAQFVSGSGKGMKFYIGDGSALPMVISPDGYVGINNANPNYRLDIAGNGRFSNELYVDGKIYATRVGGDGSSWGGAQIEVQGTNPGIGFHYPGIYGASLWMNGNGTIQWNGNGGYFENFVNTGRIIAGYDSGVAGSVNASNWFRASGATGLFWSDYQIGLFSENSGRTVLYSNSGSIALRMAKNGNDTVSYIYADSSNFGFLNGAGAWAFRIDNAGNTFTTGISLAANGFQTTAYQAGRNRIWSFANADNYGLSYHQSAGSIYGMDGIGIHFGDANAPQFNFRQNGQFDAPHIKATQKMQIPEKNSAGVPTGNVWDIYVEI